VGKKEESFRESEMETVLGKKIGRRKNITNCEQVRMFCGQNWAEIKIN
jgi:hypothetical protein